MLVRFPFKKCIKLKGFLNVVKRCAASLYQGVLPKPNKNIQYWESDDLIISKKLEGGNL
jgi:hypothetical protein